MHNCIITYKNIIIDQTDIYIVYLKKVIQYLVWCNSSTMYELYYYIIFNYNKSDTYNWCI